MAPSDRSPRPRPGSGPPSKRGGRPSGATGSSRRPGGGGRDGAPKGSGGRPERSGGRSDGPGGERQGPATAGPKRWGSLGRKGAGRLRDGQIDARDSVGAAYRDERPDPGFERVEWQRVDDVRKEASGAVRRGRSTTTNGRETPARRGRAPREAGRGTGGAQARDELVDALGATRGKRSNDRLRDAAHAFERDRFEEARTLLRPLADAAPQAATVRELYGLTLYRLGRWPDATRELEAFRSLTGSTEQHPVLADCYRAQGRHREVEDLWDDLREASPAADLVAEGRIVMAGSLADRHRLHDAITLLERSQRGVKRPKVHHLRQAYALADLYERAGDIARARELFRWVADHEPDFADAAERAGALG